MSGIPIHRYLNTKYDSNLLNVGCHAHMVPLVEATSPWENTVNQFKDYFTELNSKADAMVQDIKSSEIGRELEWVNLRKENTGYHHVGMMICVHLPREISYVECDYEYDFCFLEYFDWLGLT